MRNLASVLAFAVFTAAIVGVAQPASAAAKPSVAVINFSSEGLDDWWGSGVDPGAALADLLTDQLVNLNTLTVVDRSHIDSIMQEKNLTVGGDISPATGMKIGRLIGAKYLIVGRIVQFQKTSENGAALGSLLPHGFGGSGVRGEKVTLKVSARIIETSTGQIVETIPEEKSHVGTSFVIAGFVGGVGGAYESQQFKSSSMGILIDQAAQEMANKVDVAKMQTTGSGVAINGHVLTVEGSDVVINRGSADGVAEGMYFTVYSSKSVKDPDTGRTTTVKIKKGAIQITSVDTHSSQGKVVEGSVPAGAAVSAE